MFLEYTFQFDWTSEKRTKAMYCFVGTVFYFHNVRNAWWNTTSKRYPNVKAFCTSKEQAEGRIQARRTQGSKWQVHELPAIVVASDALAFVATEINTGSPLADLDLVTTKATTVYGISKLFTQSERDGLFPWCAGLRIMKPAWLPLITYTSHSHGGELPLGWTTSPSRRDIHPATQLCARMQKMLNENLLRDFE